MKRKLAVKRLSASDLTFFDTHFRETAGTKQKAFNLDSSVFINQLYPGLRVQSNRIPINLSIYGPGLNGLHNLQRKILKQQKNWRLNGELIYGPPEDENRYAILAVGDYAIFEFFGESVPDSAQLYLIAQRNLEDTKLFALLNSAFEAAFTARSSMALLDEDQLRKIIQTAALVPHHPVIGILDSDTLEDLVQGGIEGFHKIIARRGRRGISKEEFIKARQAAEEVGQFGEELVNSHLERQKSLGIIEDFLWASDANPISPYDFVILKNSNPVTYIDAKSTRGKFENPIHISIAELECMVNQGVVYDIYRVHSIKEERAKLRIISNMKSYAETVLAALRHLPAGTTADGISTAPNILRFDEDQEISISSE